MGPERGGEEEGAQLCQGMSRDQTYLLLEVSSERCRVEVALAGTSIFEKFVYGMLKEVKTPRSAVSEFEVELLGSYLETMICLCGGVAFHRLEEHRLL